MLLQSLTSSETAAVESCLEDGTRVVVVLLDGTTLHGRFRGIGPLEMRPLPDDAIHLEYDAPRGPPKPRYTGLPPSRVSGLLRMEWDQERVDGDTSRDEMNYSRGSLRGALRERTDEAIREHDDLESNPDIDVTTEDMSPRRFEWADQVTYPPGTLLACAFTDLARRERLVRVGIRHLGLSRDTAAADGPELVTILDQLSEPPTRLTSSVEGGSWVTVEGYPTLLTDDGEPRRVEDDDTSLLPVALSDDPPDEASRQPTLTCVIPERAFIVPPKWAVATTDPVRVLGHVTGPLDGSLPGTAEQQLRGFAVGTAPD